MAFRMLSCKVIIDSSYYLWTAYISRTGPHIFQTVMNMKIAVAAVLLIFQFLQLYHSATAAETRTHPNPLRKPGGCYEDDIGHVKEGHEVNPIPNQCARALCGLGGSVAYHSCSPNIEGTGPDCVTGEPDLKKPYPECCPVTRCS